MIRRSIYGMIAFSVLCMATASIIIRYSDAPSMAIAFYRVLFTALAAGLLGGVTLNRPAPKINKKDFMLLAGSGFFLALHFAFWIRSLDYTSVASSVLFTNLQVVFVLFFSIVFLKEKVNGWAVAGILLAVSGSLLIGMGDLGNGNFRGDMMALASGLFVAVYFIIGRQVRARINVWHYTLFVSLIAAVVLLAGSVAMNIPLTGYPPVEWLFFGLLALGPGIAGHGILNWALKYVKAPMVAVSILGESVGASIMAWIFFQESLTWYQLIGGLCILGGIYLAVVNEKTTPA
ncbi:MAG: DMT family transporter [Bacillota bacterium]|nr:DMT family transporter [Bacillota bacterium]